MNSQTSKTFIIIGGALIALSTALFIHNHRTALPQNRPKIAVVLIIDQFAYHYLPKLQKYMRYGIKKMIREGISYTNAHFPHGIPSTGPGHAGLSTGTYPCKHGIIANQWVNEHNKSVPCDLDTVTDAAVINPDGGFYGWGRSAKQVMVDGLSDQFARAATPCCPTNVFSLSLKSRSSTIPASKLGKAIWYDSLAGQFTSSTAYYEKLPEWLVAFNKEHDTRSLQSIRWDLVYDKKSGAYEAADPRTYQFTAHGKPIVETTIPLRQTAAGKKAKEEVWFNRTPGASQLLCELGKKVVDLYVHPKGAENTLLWMSFSNFDKLGHNFGPDSMECIDLLYHLDKQIGDFIEYVEKKVGRGNALFVLTSDHGVSPIPELMQERGYKNARRIRYDKLIDELNELLSEKFGNDHIIINYKTPQFYLNMPLFETFDECTQQAIYTTIKEYLLKNPNIINVWTAQELESLCFANDDIRDFYKQQLYPGRSGQIIIQVTPFTMLTDFNYGTCHRTPYEHDTHVPLIFYWPGILPYRAFSERVWAIQMPVTLAQLLHVPRPSASQFDGLPLK